MRYLVVRRVDVPVTNLLNLIVIGIMTCAALGALPGAAAAEDCAGDGVDVGAYSHAGVWPYCDNAYALPSYESSYCSQGYSESDGEYGLGDGHGHYQTSWCHERAGGLLFFYDETGVVGQLGVGADRDADC